MNELEIKNPILREIIEEEERRRVRRKAVRDTAWKIVAVTSTSLLLFGTANSHSNMDLIGSDYGRVNKYQGIGKSREANMSWVRAEANRYKLR